MLFLGAPPLERKERKEWMTNIQNKIQAQVVWVESQSDQHWISKLTPAPEVLLLNEHTSVPVLEVYSEKLKEICLLLTDGGFPCVGDPGFELVRLAHQKKVQVKTLGVHSYVMAALIMSGCSANQFTFCGYPPKDQKDRLLWIQSLIKFPATYVVIETSYRLAHLFEDLLKELPPQAYLSLSVNLGLETENVQSSRVSELRKNLPLLQKQDSGVIVFQIESKFS